MKVIFVLLALVALSQSYIIIPNDTAKLSASETFWDDDLAFPYHIDLWGDGRSCWGTLLNINTFITGVSCKFHTGIFDNNAFDVPATSTDDRTQVFEDKYIDHVHVVKMKKPLTSSKAVQPVRLPQRDFNIPFGSTVEFNVTCENPMSWDDENLPEKVLQFAYTTRLALKIITSCTDDAEINANQFCAERVSITDEKPICSIYNGTPLVMDDGTAIGIIYNQTDNQYSVRSLVNIADEIKEFADIQ